MLTQNKKKNTIVIIGKYFFFTFKDIFVFKKENTKSIKLSKKTTHLFGIKVVLLNNIETEK